MSNLIGTRVKCPYCGEVRNLHVPTGKIDSQIVECTSGGNCQKEFVVKSSTEVKLKIFKMDEVSGE